MSTKRPTKRATAKPAPAKARQAPLTSARAAPEKNSTLLKNAGDKPARYKPVNAGKGRVKGVPNAVTKSAREIFQAFIEGNAARVQELWEKVARKSPAKALSIYAKLAEFIIPKLQRTELSGGLDHRVAAITVNQNDPVELWGVYKEAMNGAEINYVDGPKPKTPEQVYQEIMMGGKARQPTPAPAAPEPTPQPESAPKAAEPDLTNVTVLESSCKLPEHRPVVDSKCPWCRQLWAKQQEAALDAELRRSDYGRPKVIT